MDITSQEIDAIVQKVLAGMQAGGGAPVQTPYACKSTVPTPAAPVNPTGDNGVFENVDDAVEAAWKAQREWVTNFKIEDSRRII